MADLEQAIAEDRAAGKRPFCISATAGTTNTGAVDPLGDLADLCEREDLWLHVDGAYGTSACLTEHRKMELAGIERAHTLTWDAHKWMFQPVECSTLLVRDRHWLGATFKETAHFLTDAEAHSKEEVGEELNYMYQGIQLTRHFRALKFWMSMKVFGLGAMRQAIERGFKLAEMVEYALARCGSMGDRHPGANGYCDLSLQAERRRWWARRCGDGCVAGRHGREWIRLRFDFQAAREADHAHGHEQSAHHAIRFAANRYPDGSAGSGFGEAAQSRCLGIIVGSPSLHLYSLYSQP